ncbi:unnamed protein product [Litomosoides sigmodontis]|uniref:Uncharacterized protein n=1 Tax=Litomosoides sigmodontis TaxID=42156 RepID=A0A3P6UG97_LITSI|nr:unnamed protein product [Litomosoides sigmodontis]
MLLIDFLTLFTTFALAVLAYGNDIIDTKRDEKRQGALNFVRPIIGTSELLQSDLVTSGKLQSEQMRERDIEILGLPKHFDLDYMPICKSNLKICKFITCSARNFQNDESLSNLNLAAQMLADAKLRKMIASDSSILLTACQEQGLSPTQCKLFANAFQLINRFIPSIEPLEEDIKKLHHYIIKDDPSYYDDSDAPPVPIQPGMHQTTGSQTWSINERNISDFDLISDEMEVEKKPNLSAFPSSSRTLRNPSHFSNSNTVAASTVTNSMSAQPSPIPSTPIPLLTFPPLIFTLPTFATVAPLVPHPLPLDSLKPELLAPVTFFTKEMQMLMSHIDNKLQLPNKISLPLPFLTLPEQFKLVNPAGSVRSKRSNDYYDNIEEYSDGRNDMSAPIDDAVDDNHRPQMIRLQKQKKVGNGLLDCMKYLKDS